MGKVGIREGIPEKVISESQMRRNEVRGGQCSWQTSLCKGPEVAGVG